MKKLIIHFISIIVFIVFQTVAFGASNTLKSEVNKKLEGQDWISINSIDNIVVGKKKWKDDKDLSSKYRMKMDGGLLYVNVEVSDDKVFLKTGDNYVSDHVEIHLADYKIDKDYKDMLDELQKNKEDIFDKNSDSFGREDKTFKKEAIKSINQTILYLNKNPWITHIAFNLNQINTIPEINRKNIKFFYEKNEPGYSFWAKISLYGAMALKEATINRIDYLIDIIDIDQKNPKTQEKIISSSDSRSVKDINTFNKYKLIDPYQFKFEDEMQVYLKVAPEGYMQLMEGKYCWMIKSEEVKLSSISSTKFFIPSGWIRLNPNVIFKDDELTITGWKSKIFIKKNKMFLIDLKEFIDEDRRCSYVLLHKYEKNKILYLLMDTSWATNPYGGMCSLASEENLIWLKLSNDLKLLDSQIFNYNSCEYRREVNDYDNPFIETDDSITVEVTDGDTKERAVYNKNKPELGIKIEEIK